MTLTPREFNIGSRINATAAHLLDAILVHGEASREQAKKAGYPSDRISIVPHGLMDHFQSYDHADLPTEDSTILFFGNIRPNKGYDRIPAILDKVESQVPDITAVVAGSPSEARFVDNGWIDETVETLRDDDRIELHNRFIPDREVGELFSRSSVVVMPYYDATSSGVAMTAYAYGTPMVATNTGDLGRMLSADGSGIVADRESDEAIGQAIIELLTDDAKRSEIRSCTRRSRQRYSWDNVAKQTVAVYKSVL
jgi:glycosyltransferase involved in cell wall biosynthesis